MQGQHEPHGWRRVVTGARRVAVIGRSVARGGGAPRSGGVRCDVPGICRHFGVCGGCQSQDVPYAEQLSQKRRAVRQMLVAAVGDRAPEIESVVGMPSGADGMPRHFRHKAAFVFAPADMRGRGLVMGHYAAGSRRVVAVAECPVHSARANSVAFALAEHLARARISAAGPRLDGLLRHLVVRTTSDDREAMALLVVTRNDRALRAPLRAFLRSADAPESLYVTVHDRDDPFMLGERPLHIHGPTHLHESIAGIVMRLSPSAFFQTNPGAARVLVEEVLAQAALMEEGNLRVLDLYAGSGLFALPLARAGHRVVAVEENPQSVRDGIANAAANRIPREQLSFVTARAGAHLRRVRSRPDLVVLDPPRQGCGDDVIDEVFVRLQPSRVVYVSCNPEAFAGEMPRMLTAGYNVNRVLPVDMFPHTEHVELIATLSRTRTPGSPGQSEGNRRTPSRRRRG